jgi:hypothetical protein
MTDTTASMQDNENPATTDDVALSKSELDSIPLLMSQGRMFFKLPRRIISRYLQCYSCSSHKARLDSRPRYRSHCHDLQPDLC